MFRRFSINFAVFSIFLDIIIIGGSLILANLIRPKLNSLPFAETVFNFTLPVVIYPIFIIAWIFIMLLFSVYDGRKNIKFFDEIISVTAASLLSGVSLAGILYLSYREISRLLFISYFVISLILLLSWRLIARFIKRSTHRNHLEKRKVLIVGAGPVGIEMKNQILLNRNINISFDGFLDDDAKKHNSALQILGRIDQARKIIERNYITDVVIALPRWAYERVNELTAELHNMPVKVWIIPDYFNLALHKAAVEEFAGIPLLDLRAPALTESQRLIKRLFDLILGTIIQIFAFPIMIVIAIAIKLDSPGPILFTQIRVGENGKLFKMYKFRSMVANADDKLKNMIKYDEEGHIIHKTKDDPRITRVGKFIRHTSLDELPQLFNVLKGEMSLVGPRPEMPLLVDQYEPWQRKRFAVPQGITGWWQVNGRSDKLMHLHTEDDIYYVQNYSLLLDLFIIIKTVLIVIRGNGAY